MVLLQPLASSTGISLLSTRMLYMLSFDRYYNRSSRLVAVDQAGQVYRLNRRIRYKCIPKFGTFDFKHSIYYSMSPFHDDIE